MTNILKSIIPFFNDKSNHTNDWVRNVAGISFFIGTLIFIIHFIIQKGSFVKIGYLYVYIAILVNLLVFVFQLFKILYLAIKKQPTKFHWISLLILLANIPIAFLYFVIVVSV